MRSDRIRQAPEWYREGLAKERQRAKELEDERKRREDAAKEERATMKQDHTIRTASESRLPKLPCAMVRHADDGVIEATDPFTYKLLMEGGWKPQQAKAALSATKSSSPTEDADGGPEQLTDPARKTPDDGESPEPPPAPTRRKRARKTKAK
jgi:hypothetical protein